MSADGIRWKKLSDELVIISGDAAFDSQNVSFWSESEHCYVCSFRIWVGVETTGVRSIARATSQDFVHWNDAVKVFPRLPGEQFYTNQTHP